MPDLTETVRANLLRVRERVRIACDAAGRPEHQVTLVGVTKYVGDAAARALVDAGCLDLGESRPQQLWDKTAALADQRIRWHQIGHLQRNKVVRTLPLVHLTHAVDSERLLRAIDDAASRDRPARVLLEVNTSGESEKHGLTADQTRDLTGRLDEFVKTEVVGLMTMAAREGGQAIARRNFAQLRELRDELQGHAPQRVKLEELSMGMSSDFEAAIAEGATIVRVGSVLWEGVSRE